MSDNNTIHQHITPPNGITQINIVPWLISNIPEVQHWTLRWRITFHNSQSNSIELEVFPSIEYVAIADENDYTYRLMRAQLLLIRMGLDKIRPQSRLLD